jgi:hypothetical protein
MVDIRIGDTVLIACRDNTRPVVITDVIRSAFDRTEVLALEFQGRDGNLLQLPLEYFAVRVPEPTARPLGR